LIKLVGEESKHTSEEDSNQDLVKQVVIKEQQLTELIESTRNELRSNSLFTAEKKNQELELFFQKFLDTGFIDSNLELRAKEKKINLQEIIEARDDLKELREQLYDLQLDGQVEIA